jgi:hypothetical protein
MSNLNKATSKTVRLGELGLDEYFREKGSNTVYHTTTYPPSNVNHTVGTRWCQNTMTFKSKWFYCRTRVKRVDAPRETL